MDKTQMQKLAEFLAALDVWKDQLSELGVTLGTLSLTEDNGNEYNIECDGTTSYLVPA